MRARASALHLCTTVPTVALILVGNNRHYVPRHHTRDNGLHLLPLAIPTFALRAPSALPCQAPPSCPSLLNPGLVRTSYKRCSYVPLTRRATITLMHCPRVPPLNDSACHRRFALSRIELNRITGSRVKIIVARLAARLHARFMPPSAVPPSTARFDAPL